MFLALDESPPIENQLSVTSLRGGVVRDGSLVLWPVAKNALRVVLRREQNSRIFCKQLPSDLI